MLLGGALVSPVRKTRGRPCPGGKPGEARRVMSEPLGRRKEVLSNPAVKDSVALSVFE